MAPTATIENIVTKDAPRAPLAPVDPNVKLPPAVVAAAARVEALHKQAYQPDAPTPPTGEVQPQPATVDGGPAPQSLAPPAPAPAPAPQPAPPAPQVTGISNQPAPPAVDEDHRFRSMQGRFHASQQQLRDAQNTLGQMSAELSAAMNRVEALEARISQPTPQRLITDKDRTDFGDEFLDAASRAARDVISPEVAALRSEVTNLKQTVQKNNIQGVYSALDQQVGENWRTVNRSAPFVHWLSLRDPISGGIRKVLLDRAFQAADAARVVAIFQSFVAEDAATRPADPGPQTQPQPAPAASGQRLPAVNLESLAAPGRARSTPGISPAAEKRIYTQADIKGFYRAVSAGIYAGRDADKDAIERDIFAAQHDGRVRG